MSEAKWIELWFESPSEGLRILVLRELADGSIELRDPRLDNKVVETFTSYEEADIWLTDEEYTLAEGRIELSAP